MSKINELRAQRAKTWEQTKAFLDSHRSDKGVLSAEDTATYEKMEQEIVDLGREIERQERLDAFERELNTPVNTPITQSPIRQRWTPRPAVLPTPIRRHSGRRPVQGRYADCRDPQRSAGRRGQ